MKDKNFYVLLISFRKSCCIFFFNGGIFFCFSCKLKFQRRFGIISSSFKLLRFVNLLLFFNYLVNFSGIFNKMNNYFYDLKIFQKVYIYFGKNKCLKLISGKDKSSYSKPDKVYNSILVSIFINRIKFKNGKKKIAEKIFYKAMKNIEEILDTDPLRVLEQAVKNVTPLMETRKTRIKGSNYHVPLIVNSKRGIHLAIHWIINSSRSHPGSDFCLKITNEIIDAYKDTGASVNKKNETYEKRELNRYNKRLLWYADRDYKDIRYYNYKLKRLEEFNIEENVVLILNRKPFVSQLDTLLKEMKLLKEKEEKNS